MMQKVYVGTPFKDYRRVIASEVPELSELATVAWNGSFFEHQWESRFEVSRKSSSGISLSKNELRLMKALLEDFFEAKSVGSVFESLFPDEFLDPEFSLGKTYKVIQRLNRKFSIVGVGFNVNNDSLKYNLVIPEGWMVLARNPDATVVNGEALGFDESELTIKFQNRPFDRKDVEQEFDLSRSSAVRWLKSLRERKVIKNWFGARQFLPILSLARNLRFKNTVQQLSIRAEIHLIYTESLPCLFLSRINSKLSIKPCTQITYSKSVARS
jgi:hypothetical protein